MKTILHLMKFLRPFWNEVFLSILLGIGTVAAGVGLLGTSAYLISAAALHPSIAELQVAIVGVRFFGISRAALRYGERLVSHSVNLRLVSSLRKWFFEQLVESDTQSLAVFRSGDLLDRVLHNLETLENFYVRVLSPYIVFSVVTAGVSLFVGHYQAILGWALAGGLLITGIVIPIFSVLFTRNSAIKATHQYSMLSAGIIESLDGLEEFSAFGSNLQMLDQVSRLSRNLSATQQAISTKTGVNNGLAILFSNLTILGLIWLTIPFVRDGEMTGILLAVVVQIAMASFEAAINLPVAAQQLTQSVAASKNLFAIANEKLVIPGNSQLDHLQNSQILEVKDVSYIREEGGFSLNDISLEMTIGKKIAMVGPSGAGKSSLVELVLKLSRPDEGSISIGEVEYSRLTDEAVRSLFGVVGQGGYLFNAGLKENLLLANPAASDADLKKAIDQVGLKGWLATLPKGMDTWLGNHGTSISGGEYQRLMLAQMILKQSPFLILDEPLTNLDMVIKNEIFKIINAAFKECAILWITHEFLFMDQMDEIIYIEAGKIIERGTHLDLMKQRGKYAAEFELRGLGEN